MTGWFRPRVLTCLAALGALVISMVLFRPASIAEPAGKDAVPSVEIYTTKSCRYCKLLRHYLDARGISYVDHDVNATRETRRAFYASGAQGVPLVVIGPQRIQGFNPFAIEKALDAEGADERATIE